MRSVPVWRMIVYREQSTSLLILNPFAYSVSFNFRPIATSASLTFFPRASFARRVSVFCALRCDLAAPLEI